MQREGVLKTLNSWIKLCLKLIYAGTFFHDRSHFCSS